MAAAARAFARRCALRARARLKYGTYQSANRPMHTPATQVQIHHRLLAGVCMGLFALWYVPYFKRARARKAQRRAKARAAAATQPCSNDSKTVSSTETPGTSTRS